MNYYIDVLIKPDAEMRLNVLLNTVYTKLHKSLCDLRSTNIGISFPNHQITLGNTLRLHGNAEALGKLQGQNWIGGMSGYCQQSQIKSMPSDVKFRTVSRKQPAMTPAKLRRLIKRNSINEEQAREYKAMMFTKGLDNPYLELVSGSNGQRHRRYIEFGPLLDSLVEGEFDQFGLSKTATVPWF